MKYAMPVSVSWKNDVNIFYRENRIFMQIGMYESRCSYGRTAMSQTVRKNKKSALFCNRIKP